MTKREIASLAIKLMGVFILIKSISYTPMVFSGIFSIWRPTVDKSGIAWAVLLTVISLILSAVAVAVSLLVIVFSDKVAAWLIKEEQDKLVAIGGSVSKEDVMLSRNAKTFTQPFSLYHHGQR